MQDSMVKGALRHSVCKGENGIGEERGETDVFAG